MGYKKTDICIEKAYDDERLFVLMARDPEAPRTIIHWISRSLNTQPPEKLHEALDAAMEMHKAGQTFRDRKEKAKREGQEAADRYDFEQWKKRQAQGERLVDAGLAMRVPTMHDGAADHSVGNYESALKEKSDQVNFARNFANYLDAMGNGAKIEKAKATAHGFAHLVDEFIKSIPNR